MKAASMLKEHIKQQLNVNRFAFTEIASAQADQVADALEILGFELFRRHRSKKIRLYKSYETYLMLHETPASLPMSLGVVVDDVDAALRTATALSAQASIEIHTSGPIGSMGLHIPALRLANGGYIYLVEIGEMDSFFAFDFVQP